METKRQFPVGPHRPTEGDPSHRTFPFESWRSLWFLQQGEEGDSGSVDNGKVFVEKVLQCKEEKFKSVGHGWDHRFEGPGIVGSTLVHQEKVIHMAFFGTTESEKVGPQERVT